MSNLEKSLKEFKDHEILITLDTPQLNLFGQTFRPLFVGKVVDVKTTHVTLAPVTIKMVSAPFYTFPTPLSFPFEKIAAFTPFDSSTVFPLS